MSESKFAEIGPTPGPWIAASSPSSIVGWPIVGPRGRAVASVHCRKGDTPEGEQINAEAGANARLIASAPDLLGALRDARTYLPGRPGCPPSLLERVDAAIAKAEGTS